MTTKLHACPEKSEGSDESEDCELQLNTEQSFITDSNLTQPGSTKPKLELPRAHTPRAASASTCVAQEHYLRSEEVRNY